MFDGQPISNEELETMRIKLLSSEIPVLSAAHNGNVRFTVRAERIADRDGTLVYFFFERLDAQEAEALQLEKINHLPLLAADSAAMKNLLLAAEAPACASSLLLLGGKDGLAKQELARYLHVFHGKTGFFAEASAQNLQDIEISSLPDSISTLFIELTAIPDEKKTAYLTVIAQLAAAKNIQLIISIPALTTELAEHTGFEQAILLAVPTLVNRQADIPALVQTYLEEFHQTLGTQPVKVQKAALETIVHSVKDSNLASLKAYVKNLALIEKTYVIGSHTLQKTAFMPIGDSAHGMISIDDNETLKEIEQKIINHVLKEEKLNQTKAAHRLGINRATLWRKLKS
ncbi:helix-turn-helix domain-containing protein [Planococcus koreensis]|uniref:helix-turn-helix domain-containing protein n=1 Tax=Planococcus koreensis TaxID=112331 RepID=UPI0039FD75E2